METTRRGFIKLALAGGFAPYMSPLALAAPSSEREELYTQHVLSNGLRVHHLRSRSKYVSTALVLRSREIMNHSGLAHILEHTSFTGAAGNLSAQDVKQRQRRLIQDSNATTSPGRLEWFASFLPKYASDALHILAVTSLDQKFDSETVESEARIVLEELLLEKHSSEAAIRRKFNSIVFGRDHPRGADTLDEEIALAKLPTRKLVAKLLDYASLIRLPGNMDLFVVGDVESSRIADLAERHFGKYPSASAPMLVMPPAPPTKKYMKFEGISGELSRPLSEVRLAWNTGVTINNPDACILLALGDYINEMLFRELRERDGASYSPEAYFEPDDCSGILSLSARTSKRPEQVERRICSVLGAIKERVDAAELELYRERRELKRLKVAESGESLLQSLVGRVIDGCALEDLDINLVSAEQLTEAARRFLPSYRGPYFCVELRGT